MFLYLSVEHGQIFDEAGYVCNHFVLYVKVKKKWITHMVYMLF